MLSFISWPQYLAAVAIIGLAYYSFVLAKYYRMELVTFFQPKQIVSDTRVKHFDGNFIGGIKSDPGETSIDAEDLRFTESAVETEIISEIRELINAFKGLDQKEEFLSLLSLIISKYTGIEFDRNLLVEQVLQYSEPLTFKLSQEDLEQACQQAA